MNGDILDKVIHNSKIISPGFDQEISTSGRIGVRDANDKHKFDVER